MRTAVLLAATALAVSACTTAQGATGTPPPPPGTEPAAAPASATTSTLTPPTTPPATPAPAGSPSPSPSPPPPALLSPEPSGSASSVVDPAAVGSPAPVGALILGDSISLSIANELSRYGYPVIGLVGQSASESYLRMHLSTPLAQAAETWVIVLGTNNSGSPEDVAQLERLVEVIDGLRTPGAKQQVRWVTPHRPEAYVGGRTAYNLDAFNLELSRLAADRRWLRILDFDSLAKANPAWFDADTAMHLHPDQIGQDALVALITGPAPVAADTPAVVIDGAPSLSPGSTVEPETFDNATLPANPRPPAPEPSPSPDASSAVVESAAPEATMSDEASQDAVPEGAAPTAG
jgi:hypothetical protein